MEKANEYAAAGTVPLLMEAEGQPMRRIFVHVEDLVEAVLAENSQPVEYGQPLFVIK